MKTIAILIIIILLAVGISLMIPGVRKAIFELAISTAYGRLSIGDENSTMEYIFMNMNGGGTYFLCPNWPDYGSCQNNPVEDDAGGARAITILAQIYDPNNDCNTDDIYIYVCPNSTLPNNLCYGGQSSEVGAPSVIFATKSQDGLHCNFSATYSLNFFRRYGVWRVNATTRDPNVGTGNFYSSIMKGHSVGMSHYYKYPYIGNAQQGSEIFFGPASLAVNAWTNGTAQNTTKNTGNSRFNMSFSSNNFTCNNVVQCSNSNITIDLAYSGLVVDNDTSHTDGSSIPFDAIPMNTIWWFPPNGVRRCNNTACNLDDEGISSPNGNRANFTISYDIYINASAQSIPAGTYNNTFNITTYDCEPTYYGRPCGSASGWV
jgi:hypothetical protein